MKKSFRKYAALLTVAAIILGLCAPVFAAETATVNYDMAQGMAYLTCSNANGITAASVNDGSSVWSFGYTKNGTLTYYPHLQRRLWNVAVGKTDGWGGGTQTINDRVVLDPFVTGAIGYGFGANYDWNTLPVINNGHLQPTAVWKAEYAGNLTATLKLGQPATTEANADGVLFRVDKVTASGTTTVYPVNGTITSGDGTEGWAKVPQGAAPTTYTFTASVAAGDKLVLRFDNNVNDLEDRMTLYSYVLSQTVSASDLNADLKIDDLDDADTPDDTDDLFFDFSKAFAVRNRFSGYTGNESYLNYRGNRETKDGVPTGLYTGLFPSVPNRVGNRFEIGYYSLVTEADSFVPFTHLAQSSVSTVSLQDPKGGTPSLSYGMRITEMTGQGYPIDPKQPAAIGTLFGRDKGFVGNSFAGENVRATIRFNVPRAGLLTLSLGMHGPADATSDGVLYRLVRKYGDGFSKVLSGGYQTAPSDFSSNWSVLASDTKGQLVREVVSGISVSAGDVIELTFDKNETATGDLFDLVYYTVQYLDYDAPDKMVYDMGEGLAVSDTFNGDTTSTATDYKSLTPVYENTESSISPWRYGYYDKTGNYRASTVLTRPWFTTTRAPEDQTPAYVDHRTPALSYGHASRLQNSGTTYGWDLKSTGVGYVGYDFSTVRNHGSNSFPGYSASGRAAVRFIAPKSGSVSPFLEFAHLTEHSSTKDGVLFKLYKKSVADGSITQVYPKAGETTYTASDSTTGWALIPGGGAEAIWENAVVGVKTGDELILHFDQNKYANSDEFTIRTYTITYLTQTKTEYDMGEAFAVSNTFRGGLEGLYYDYAEGLTPVTPNGAGQWTLGYYNWNDESFTPFTYLNRGNFTTTRAPEDTNNLWPGSSTTLIWSTTGTVNTYQPTKYVPEEARENGATGNAEAYCSPPAAIGYNFGNGTKNGNSFPGHNTGAQAAVRFRVDHPGFVTPTLKIMDALNNGGVLYRVYKVDGKTGAQTSIYPAKGEVTYTSADAKTDGWCLLPAAATEFTLRDDGVVSVDVGDEIVFRFDKYTAGWPSSKNFIIDTLKINYVEVYEGNPIKSYYEDVDVFYDETNPQLDLRVEKTSEDLYGTIVYTIDEDAVGVLRETSIPGVYLLTGEANTLSAENANPAKVTASYYALGNNETPVYSTSTKVFVRPNSARYKALTATPFKTTQLGLANDGFLLPYYADATDRALYGAIDLGLHDEWKGADVTFSKDGYFEYLGNGRIRALKKYTYATAGATWNSTAGLQATAPAYVSPNATIPAKRDANTVGTPIVMRLTAADGGVQEYNLWAFETAIHRGEASDSYIFKTSYGMSNAVTKFESYIGDGTFRPMYPDSARNVHISSVADDMYAQKGSSQHWFPWVPTLETTGDLEFVTVNAAGWTNYVSNTPYIDHDGVSWTFVAPKDGLVNLTDYMPATLYSSNNGYYLKNGDFMGSVRKYAQDGSYVSLYEMNYAKSTYNSSARSLTGTVTYSTAEEDGSLNVNVKMGDVIRIILYSDYETSGEYGSTTIPDASLPHPVFTYASSPESRFEVTETAATFTQVITETEGLSGAAKYLGVAFDSNGLVIGATRDVTFAPATQTVPATATGSIATDGKAAYVKLFFWEDLENIRPLNGGVTIR